MPPKKGIARVVKKKAPAKGDATKLSAASTPPPKKGPGRPPKEPVDDDAMEVDTVEEQTAKKGPGRPKKIVKAESSSSEEHVVKTQPSKRGPGRPPKQSVSDAEENMMETPAKKRAPGRPPKRGSVKQGSSAGNNGSWIYTADNGTVAEGDVVDAGFPWVLTVTLKKDDVEEYQTYQHRTAFSILNGKIAFFEKNKAKFTATGEGALSGILDKESEILVINKKTMYRVGLVTKACKMVEGHEVLDEETRDRLIVSGEIEWDDEVDCDAVGKVTKGVVDDGDVTDRVLADHQAAKDEEDREEEPQEPVTPSHFKHGEVEEAGDAVGDAEKSEVKKEERQETSHYGPNLDVPKDEAMLNDDDGKPELKETPPKKNGKGHGKGVKK